MVIWVPPQKRSRSGDDTTVRLLIPSKAAGSIIGKGGHNITKLRTEYKASVTVPDCPGPERILTISSDLDTVLQVVSEIIPNIEDASGRSGRSSEDVDLRMLVHQSQAGCIIGKSGFKIKELREKTGARIKIFSNCYSIKEIMELIKTSPIKGMNNPYDPHNYDDFHAQEYGGFGDVDGKGGRGGPGGMYGGMGGPPPMGRGGRFGGPGVGNMGPGPRGGPRGGMGGPPGGMGPMRGGGFGGGRGGFGGNRGNASNGMMGNSLNMGGNNVGGPGPMLGSKGSTQVTIPKD
ncbi:hypothetical protein L9F63_015811, partial [Diploptera punctata]